MEDFFGGKKGEKKMKSLDFRRGLAVIVTVMTAALLYLVVREVLTVHPGVGPWLLGAGLIVAGLVAWALWAHDISRRELHDFLVEECLRLENEPDSPARDAEWSRSYLRLMKLQGHLTVMGDTFTIRKPGGTLSLRLPPGLTGAPAGPGPVPVGSAAPPNP